MLEIDLVTSSKEKSALIRKYMPEPEMKADEVKEPKKEIKTAKRKHEAKSKEEKDVFEFEDPSIFRMKCSDAVDLFRGCLVNKDLRYGCQWIVCSFHTLSFFSGAKSAIISLVNGANLYSDLDDAIVQFLSYACTSNSSISSVMVDWIVVLSVLCSRASSFI